MNESLNNFDADVITGDVNINMGKEGKSFEAAMMSSGCIRHPYLFTTKFYTEIDVVFRETAADVKHLRNCLQCAPPATY